MSIRPEKSLFAHFELFFASVSAPTNCETKKRSLFILTLWAERLSSWPLRLGKNDEAEIFPSGDTRLLFEN